jgi:predicted aspartyl protease
MTGRMIVNVLLSAWMLLLPVEPGHSQDHAIPLGDTLWQGSYSCNQGQTSLHLKTQAAQDGTVNALFEFGPISGNDNLPRGSFSLKGIFQSSDGFMQLDPVGWISQPSGYSMVGLVGVVSGSLYQGSVIGYRCERFSVSRAEAVTGSPLSSAPKAKRLSIPLRSEGGTLTVSVSINNKLTLDFVIDSGAADVSIPADVALTLIRTGTLSSVDFLGKQTYRLADGSTVPSQTFRIKSLRVGDRVLQNVIGSIAPVKGELLLGQSFLSRFTSWSIDNQRHVLVLD